MDFAYVYSMKFVNVSADTVTESVQDRHFIMLQRKKLCKDLLEKCFREKLSEYPAPNVVYNQLGKPSLEKTDLFVSFSYCENAVACAVSNREIGIDIEKILGSSAICCDFFLSAAEKNWAFSHREPLPYLTMLWSMKEAYGKYLGIGLRYPFSKTSFCFELNTIYHLDMDFVVGIFEPCDSFILTSWSKIQPEFYCMSDIYT